MRPVPALLGSVDERTCQGLHKDEDEYCSSDTMMRIGQTPGWTDCKKAECKDYNCEKDGEYLQADVQSKSPFSPLIKAGNENSSGHNAEKSNGRNDSMPYYYTAISRE